MEGHTLREARRNKSWTQEQTARALGVTQAYLSMIERGRRVASDALVHRALKALTLPPTALPLRTEHVTARTPSGERPFWADLAGLGYPGFAYLRKRARRNPAEVLLDALNESNLDARVAEALPWLPLAYGDMDWGWLVRNTKLADRQNRLGFAVSLASEVAEATNEREKARKLREWLDIIEKARLAREDTFCRDSMTKTEKAWLREHRSPTAAHWNLLTDMKGEKLAYGAR